MTKENLQRYSEEGFGANRNERECGIGLKKIGERSSRVRRLLKGKLWTLNENNNDDDDAVYKILKAEIKAFSHKTAANSLEKRPRR